MTKENKPVEAGDVIVIYNKEGLFLLGIYRGYKLSEHLVFKQGYHDFDFGKYKHIEERHMIYTVEIISKGDFK